MSEQNKSEMKYMSAADFLRDAKPCGSRELSDRLDISLRKQWELDLAVQREMQSWSFLNGQMVGGEVVTLPAHFY